jgi:hypothetical protein
MGVPVGLHESMWSFGMTPWQSVANVPLESRA